MNEVQILQYQAVDGDVPFRKWFKSIKDVRIRSRIRTRIDRLELGHFGDVKSIGSGVCELRLFFGAGYRIYYAQYKKTIVVLLCGGDKKQQNKDIEKAKEYWKDFKRRV